jgi:hypothetical protein
MPQIKHSFLLSSPLRTERRIVTEMTRETPHTMFCMGNLWERDHLEDPGVDGRLILRWILKMWDGGLGLIDLAQGGDMWRLL